MKRLLVFALIGLLAVPTYFGFAGVGDWEGFFGNPSHTNCTLGPNLPTPMMRYWSYFPEGGSTLFPVVKGDYLYSSDDSGAIFCLDRKTGEEVWKYKFEFPTTAFIGITNKGLAFSTANVTIGFGGAGRRGGRGGRGGGGGGGGGRHPAGRGTDTSTNNIYFRSAVGNAAPLFMVEEEEVKNYIGMMDLASGKVLWKKEITDGMPGLMLVSGDKLFVPITLPLAETKGVVTSKMVCMSVEDGKELWTFMHTKSISYTTYGDGKLFITSMKIVINEETELPEISEAELTCVSEDGKKLWQKTDFEGNILGITSYASGTVYMIETKMNFDQNQRFIPPTSWLCAFSAEDGKTKWRTESKSDFFLATVPAVTPNGIILQGTQSKTICFEAKEGKELWATSTSGGFCTGLQFVCTSDQAISARQSKISVIDLKTGTEVFADDTGMKPPVEGGLMMGGMIISFPAISSDMAYVAGDRVVGYGVKVIRLMSEPEAVKVDQIEVGQTKTRQLKVIYNDVAEISGTLSTNKPWIKLSATDYKLATQVYEVTLSAEGLQPGSYEGSIQVEASVGKLAIPVIMKVVPKPSIKLIVNLDDTVYTNKNPLKVTGETIPGATLAVSGRPINVSSDGKFSDNIPLKPGNNTLIFDAKDAKGNTAQVIKNVVLDDKAPRLQVEARNNSLVKQLPFKFMGQTEPKAKVKINGSPVEISEKGEFEAVFEELPDGPQTITITAEDMSGNVTTVTINIIVNTKPLLLKVDLPQPFVTNKPELEIQGQTEPGVVIGVMGGEGAEPIIADENGKFTTKVKLNEGQNRVIIQAADDIGREAVVMLLVILDTTPPQINCEVPQLVSEASLTLKGTTEKEAKVVVNGTEAQVDDKGNFQATLTLKPGLNPVKIVATDMAGNVKEISGFVKFEEPKKIQTIVIKLWIGKVEMTVNSEKKTLPSAPVTSSPPLPKELAGNTYMPIRPVAEALGAKLDYNATEKKVTITQTVGSKTKIIELWISKNMAKIDGVEMPIHSSGKLYPVIVGGSTLLPLRFVGEALGADVAYEAASKMITLTYPKP